MEPSNILISESQERMLIVSPPENKEKIFEIFEKWELEYSVIGSVNTSGEYKVYNYGEILFKGEKCAPNRNTSPCLRIT